MITRLLCAATLAAAAACATPSKPDGLPDPTLRTSPTTSEVEYPARAASEAEPRGPENEGPPVADDIDDWGTDWLDNPEAEEPSEWIDEPLEKPDEPAEDDPIDDDTEPGWVDNPVVDDDPDGPTSGGICWAPARKKR